MLAHIAAAATLLLLDFAWLHLYMASKYKELILRVQQSKMEVNMYSAVGAYVCMIIGLVLFVTKPLQTQHKRTVLAAFLQGFPYGAVLYGVYNLTNLSIFSKWNISLALLDTVWGGLVYSAAAYVSLLAT